MYVVEDLIYNPILFLFLFVFTQSTKIEQHFRFLYVCVYMYKDMYKRMKTLKHDPIFLHIKAIHGCVCLCLRVFMVEL